MNNLAIIILGIAVITTSIILARVQARVTELETQIQVEDSK